VLRKDDIGGVTSARIRAMVCSSSRMILTVSGGLLLGDAWAMSIEVHAGYQVCRDKA